LLGVRAVIAESYERIHRSNLVGMGVLPLQYLQRENRASLELTGEETFDVLGLEDGLRPGQRLTVHASIERQLSKEFEVVARLDSAIDVMYYRHGGVLQLALRQLIAES
jgi:aconitate hydratase